MTQSMTVAHLDLVVRGQRDRCILEKSKKTYLSKCKVMTEILLKFPELHEEAFICENRIPLKHTGEASKVYKLKLPISVNIATKLFGAISIDDTLPSRKRKRSDDEETVVDNVTAIDDGTVAEESDVEGEGTQSIQRQQSSTNEANGTVLNAGNGNSDALNPGQDKVTVSAQTYQNYKSALVWWHALDNESMDKKGFPWPEEVDTAVKIQVAAYKRDIGAKKRKGIMKQRDGKMPYNLLGYKEICRFFCQMRPLRNMYTWNEGIFAGLFTKLSVNTIGRSDNIDDLLYSNIDWVNDSMTIRFGTTKADQTGEKTSELKRIFSNPFLPEVCVILQLAIYTWCCGLQSGNDQRFLFPGRDQNKRYYNALKVALRNIDNSIDLGTRREDIGTHSNRKFAESTSVSKIDGPSRTQVCLRAGQGVGRTQDCYMFSEDDGDALVGRTVAQLQLTADEFDILPPHFGKTTLVELDQYGWSRILCDYSKYPESFQRVIPHLFAHLVYHWHKTTLTDLLPQDHPLFQQSIFTDRQLIDSLKDKVIFVHAFCQDTLMNAQGVPGIILISRELRNFRKHYDETRCTFQNGLSQVQRSVEQLESGMHRDLPKEIVQEIMKRIAVEGATPISLEDIRTIIKEMMESDTGYHHQMMKALEETKTMFAQMASGPTRSSGDTNSANDSTAATTVQENSIIYDAQCKTYLHYWGNQFHRVPKGFKFPSYNTRTMWLLWFFGRPIDRISPYRKVQPKFDLERAVCSTNFYRTQAVMKRMIQLLVADGKIRSIRDISPENAAILFDHAYPKLIASLYQGIPDRVYDINVNTVGNRINELNKTNPN